MDALDRELICQAGWRGVTAPLTLEGLPEGARVLVLEPEWFSGPLHSGQRVPLGTVKVVVATPGRPPEEAVIAVEGPRVWSPGLPGVVPEGVPEGEEGTGRWPAWVGAGAGALLVGAGLWLGVTNRDELAATRARQQSGACPDTCAGELRSAESTARLADGLWIGGSVVLVSSAVLGWLWLEDAP